MKIGGRKEGRQRGDDYLYWMKSFLYDISPINTKKRREEEGEEGMHKFEGKDLSGTSHFFDLVNFSNHILEQKIIATAKTIVYLFSPDIDLLEKVENNIENYDKYQKTKRLLRELVGSMGSSDMQSEVMKTSEEIEKLQGELEELSLAFHHLQGENRQKNEEIAKYRGSIIELSHAYEQAKIYYSDEILELKYQVEELKNHLERKAKKEKSSSKGKKVTLNIPTESKRADSEAYTDRSIYKRFSTSQINEQPHIDSQQHIPKERKVVLASAYSVNRHLIEKYEFQKELLEQKIVKLEEKLSRTEEDSLIYKKEAQAQRKELIKKITKMQTQIKEKTAKLKEKNRTITQLLDSLQGRTSCD